MDLHERIEHYGCSILVRVVEDHRGMVALVTVTTPFPGHIAPLGYEFPGYEIADDALRGGLEKGRQVAEGLAKQFRAGQPE